jgi:DNA repair protein RadC
MHFKMELLSSRRAAYFLRKSIGTSDVEEFWAIALNPMCKIIKSAMLFRGTVDTCFIHPRDVYRFALSANASSIIVGHNHPSGVCEPSQADEELTKSLRQSGAMLQIPLIDHVIITNRRYFSFAESRWPADVSVQGSQSPREKWLLRSPRRRGYQRY